MGKSFADTFSPLLFWAVYWDRNHSPAQPRLLSQAADTRVMKLKMNMTRARRTALFRLLFCGGISVFLGYAIACIVPNGMGDFKAVYYAARCLIQHKDPYNVGEPLRVYLAEGGGRVGPSDSLKEVLSLHLYPPTTFIITAPFAMLPFGLAHILWVILTAGSLLLAAFLMWNLAGDSSPGVSLFLICFVLANSEMLFVFGNSAGLSISLCLVAVWCFLQNRFVPAGILCLAVSLAIKPHDAGLVWLYFLLAGGVYRKRALQTLALIFAMGLPVLLWVTRVAPHWLSELRANLLTESAHGYLSDPGPASSTGHEIGMLINLQSILSVFRDDPRFYNPVSYLTCGILLLIWSVHTLRSRFSQPSAKLALAAVASFTMLVGYHRVIDAKLLLLTVPACAMLCDQSGTTRRIALLLNGAAIVLTSDFPLAIFLILTRNLSLSANGLLKEILMVILLRPIPLFLLAMGIFYLWMYLRSGAARIAAAKTGERAETPLALARE